MKILVYAHVFEMGGTQVNAIELSAALRDLYGHDVSIYASPGPMVAFAEQKGLRFIAAPRRYHVSNLTMMRGLDRVLQSECPDVVQAWEKAQSLEAFYVAAMLRRIPVLAIDMRSDMICPMLPKTPITTFGTPEFVDQARAIGRRNAALLVPPVDVHTNAPGLVNAKAFRSRYGISNEGLTLVSVSRLTTDMNKDEALDRLIAAVGTLGHSLPLQLVVVGDGNARGKLEQRAAAANSRLGRTAVVLTGEILDPRAAYQTADVVVAMGSSALRGMAFGKPVIVVGSRGFAEVLNAETALSFYYKGLYGIGDGDAGNEKLIRIIREMASSPGKLRSLGEFGRSFVVRHFSLEVAAASLDAYCRKAAEKRLGVGSLIVDALRTTVLCSARIVNRRTRGRST